MSVLVHQNTNRMHAEVARKQHPVTKVMLLAGALWLGLKTKRVWPALAGDKPRNAVVKAFSWVKSLLRSGLSILAPRTLSSAMFSLLSLALTCELCDGSG